MGVRAFRRQCFVSIGPVSIDRCWCARAHSPTRRDATRRDATRRAHRPARDASKSRACYFRASVSPRAPARRYVRVSCACVRDIIDASVRRLAWMMRGGGDATTRRRDDATTTRGTRRRKDDEDDAIARIAMK